MSFWVMVPSPLSMKWVPMCTRKFSFHWFLYTEKKQQNINYIFHFSESWEKVNIVQNDNGTLTYSLKKIYVFREELSVGSDDDVVIVPNIPMLSATSQSKHAARWVCFYSRPKWTPW